MYGPAVAPTPTKNKAAAQSEGAVQWLPIKKRAWTEDTKQNYHMHVSQSDGKVSHSLQERTKNTVHTLHVCKTEGQKR